MPQPTFSGRAGIASIFAAALMGGAAFATPDVRAEEPPGTFGITAEEFDTDTFYFPGAIVDDRLQEESLGLDGAQTDDLFGRDKHAPFLKSDDDDNFRK